MKSVQYMYLSFQDLLFLLINRHERIDREHTHSRLLYDVSSLQSHGVACIPSLGNGLSKAADANGNIISSVAHGSRYAILSSLLPAKDGILRAI